MRGPLQPDKTRARILKAAEACFAEHGYAATGMDELCRRAQVSRGAFYHHFPSKQAVFMALLRQWLAGFETQVAAASETPGGVPEQLLNMARAARPAFEASRQEVGLFLEFWSQATREPAIRAVAARPYHEYQATFARLLAAGVAEGSLAPVAPAVAAKVITALAVGLMAQRLFDPDEADWGQVAESGIRLLLDGLRKKS